MKILLAVCSACHPHRFDMFWKKNFGHPQHHKVPPLGHDQGDRMKIPSNMFCIFHLHNTHKVWYQNLRNLNVNRNLMILMTLGWKFYLHSVLLVIPVDLICHMTMFEKKFFNPSAPQRPKVRPLGHDPGNRIKIQSDMFCIFHLWEQTQCLV